MICIKSQAAAILVLVALSLVTSADGATANRLVKYHKKLMMQGRPPVHLKARVVRKPPDYVDSKVWSLDSIQRVMVFVKGTSAAKAIRKAFSLYKSVLSEPQVQLRSLRTVKKSLLIIDNYREAQLPSSRISLSLIKDYLTPQEILHWLKRRPSRTSLRSVDIVRPNKKNLVNDRVTLGRHGDGGIAGKQENVDGDGAGDIVSKQATMNSDDKGSIVSKQATQDSKMGGSTKKRRKITYKYYRNKLSEQVTLDSKVGGSAGKLAILDSSSSEADNDDERVSREEIVDSKPGAISCGSCNSGKQKQSNQCSCCSCCGGGGKGGAKAPDTNVASLGDGPLEGSKHTFGGDEQWSKPRGRGCPSGSG